MEASFMKYLNSIFRKFSLDPSERLCNRVMNIDGHLSRSEAKVLFELAKAVKKNEVIIEIGSFKGRSTLALALGSLSGNNNRVYAIDPHLEFRGILGADQAYLYKVLVRNKVGHIVFVVSLKSEQVAMGWQDKNIGLLWIDGDHTYKAVRKDFESWYPYLTHDSVIVFHDCNTDGIKKLINEICEQKLVHLRGSIDTLQWFVYGK